MPRRAARTVDPLDVVESAYRVDGPDETWLAGILERFAPVVDEDHGVLAYLYDAAARPLRIWSFVGECAPTKSEIDDVVRAADDEYVASSYLVTPFGTASDHPGFDRQITFQRRLGPYGVKDAIAMNSIDPSGLGAWIGALLPEKRTATGEDRDRWGKVSAHVVAALRLRKRLSSARPAAAPALDPASADAVLTTSGSLEHAANPNAAVEDERRSLAEAVKRLDRARGGLRRTNPEEAIEEWRVLVRARWSLVDQFESDGKRYVLAYSNPPSSPGPVGFTDREREIVALAMLGRAPKLIAYELGLAPSTVRVHLTNASRKLGVRTLNDLITRYRAWMLEGPGDA